MTTNVVAVPLTAVLCTAVSSVISSLVTALVMYYCFMKRKTGSDEDDRRNPPQAEPMYETPQVFGESSANIELKQDTYYESISESSADIGLKQNTCYDTPQVFGENSADIELKQNPCYESIGI